ncbi:MAG TPA: SDR family oxidoreductase [Acidimicrobiia bacterium]|nr:SDR family oxidoreductase [Acidimicrobiia bacterium]
MATPRVAIVTGAASGMGRAAALRLARTGTKVAAVDRTGEALKDLEAAEPGVSAFECDVADADAVARVAGEIRTRLGDTDRLVNAAGICLAGTIGAIPTADFRHTMEVNYFGTLHWVDAVLPAMRARRRGEIVNFASIAGFLPTPGVAAYGASKFAVLGFTETLAEETRSDGIRVVCVCPPAVDTPMLADIMAGTSLGARINKFVKPISAETVIDAIDKTLPGTRLLVLPGPGTAAMWRLRRYAPAVMTRLFRLVYGL